MAGNSVSRRHERQGSITNDDNLYRTAMSRVAAIAQTAKPFLFYGLVLFGLYLASLYNYLLFHSLVEIFSVVVGFSIFVLAWNSRERLENDFVLFLGIAYLFVSGLDLVHTLAYKGMGIFQSHDANLPTQLWIAARFVQSLSLLIAPVFLRRKLQVHLMFGIYAVVSVGLTAAMFADVFPACYVEGSGLTPFKIISEHVISLILVAAIVLLMHYRAAFDRKVVQWLVASLVFTIGAELAFTFYVSVYGLGNLIGHFFKLIAFYLIYIAIVEMGLKKPQRLLFRNLKRQQEALKNALQEVQRLAITDPLTGLYNRGHFSKVGEDEVRRAVRYGHPLSAIMLDIDHFKRANDTYGHSRGDHILREVAERCRHELRAVDVMGRYGGDEFVILLPENDLAAARRVAERLRKSIAQQKLHSTEGQATVTASLGVAALNREDSTLEALLSRADQALYVAKEGGRNRVST
jgi:diguanylate cyclase (GGDEF)-like protein